MRYLSVFLTASVATALPIARSEVSSNATAVLPWDWEAAGGNGITCTKATVFDLPYSFDALEPVISREINELHYTKHHKTYAANFNKYVAEYHNATRTNDTAAIKRLLPLLNFNAGGVINHNLWWRNLAPKNESVPPANDTLLAQAIKDAYGTLTNLTDIVNTKLAGIQGSGWAWIVKNKTSESLDVITTANQEVVPDGLKPIIGIDAWEHAYYLQYKNVKTDYFKGIWNVINWTEAEGRYASY